LGCFKQDHLHLVILISNVPVGSCLHVLLKVNLNVISNNWRENLSIGWELRLDGLLESAHRIYVVFGDTGHLMV
jgi:hypothetical protein